MIPNMYFRNVETFISYTKVNSNLFINYCEIVIDRYGGIHMAIPSHEEKLIEMVCNDLGMIDKKDIIQKYRESKTHMSPVEYLCSLIGAISIWYGGMCAPQVNNTQIHILTRLYEEKLINFIYEEMINDKEMEIIKHISDELNINGVYNKKGDKNE